MSISVSNEADRTVIRVKGRLDFNLRQAFREAYQSADSSKHYILDFSENNYLDSSALGMLLLMREYVLESAKVPIEIRHCCSEVKAILQITNLSKFFTIA